ncbi:MAG: SLC13 family permease [Prevotella sp.]|jgi:Na+/H+ antiporter NhaD/arsenite permease-like protein
MTLIIVVIVILGFILIATETLTNVNKAAVAIFAGTVGWVLYICYGTDYVMSQHPLEYTNFLNGAVTTSTAVKEYIASHIFLKYVGRAAEVVLFLLATMTIVEILYNNGCFDFISQLMKTRSSRRLLWILSSVTFVLSANLDNLTTTVMMLVIMRKIVSNHSQRLVLGSAILLAANCGGALTVIGAPTGLVLWNNGLVSATAFSTVLILPCLLAWLIPTWWIGRMLPERIETEWISMPYRGDDTRLTVPQRLMMLIVGIGGLWFIPTFHDITKLSPFLGALCVLSVLWVVNEIFNHKLMNSDIQLQRRVPRMLQYGVIQMMLYVMGIMLALGVVKETGALDWLWLKITAQTTNYWLVGLVAGVFSTVLENFATAMSFFQMHPATAINDGYWTFIVYCVMVGGNLLCCGSVSGIALMKSEHVRVGWFFRNVGWKTLIGGLAGGLALILIQIFITR